MPEKSRDTQDGNHGRAKGKLLRFLRRLDSLFDDKQGVGEEEPLRPRERESWPADEKPDNAIKLAKTCELSIEIVRESPVILYERRKLNRMLEQALSSLVSEYEFMEETRHLAHTSDYSAFISEQRKELFGLLLDYYKGAFFKRADYLNGYAQHMARRLAGKQGFAHLGEELSGSELAYELAGLMGSGARDMVAMLEGIVDIAALLPRNADAANGLDDDVVLPELSVNLFDIGMILSEASKAQNISDGARSFLDDANRLAAEYADAYGASRDIQELLASLSADSVMNRMLGIEKSAADLDPRTDVRDFYARVEELRGFAMMMGEACICFGWNKGINSINNALSLAAMRLLNCNGAYMNVDLAKGLAEATPSRDARIALEKYLADIEPVRQEFLRRQCAAESQE